MSEINNPIRITNSTREYNIKEILGPNRQVVEMDIRPGNIYIHWEEREPTMKDAKETQNLSLLGAQRSSKGGRRDG